MGWFDGGYDLAEIADRRPGSLRDDEAPEGEEVMSLPLYERVALKRDLPEYNLRTGDVAVLVDDVPHPQGGEPGCVLEVFNALGESIAVVAVRKSDIESLRADEVLAVRPLARAM
jgi:hypothetical protein